MDLVLFKNGSTKIYSIHQFIKMAESERNQLKGFIFCESCGGKAYYRKESRDGKKACFGAKHKNGCDNGATNKGAKHEADFETNTINQDSSIFKMRWNYKKSKKSSLELNNKDNENIKLTSSKQYTKDPAVTKYSSISLIQILKYSETNIINDQDILVFIDGQEIELKDIVFKFSEINESHIGKYGFFWGEMRYLNKNFIELRNSKQTSILIGNQIIEEFDLRHRDKFFKVVHSNSIIIFGKVIKTKTKKFLIILDDVNRIYFKKRVIK